MNTDLNEELRRMVLARLGMRMYSKDYALERIVRTAAMAMGAEVAAFSVAEGDQQLYLACFGTELEVLPAERSLCRVAFDRGAPVFVDDLRSDHELAAHPHVAEAPQLHAWAGAPVLSPEKQPIGTLSVWSGHPGRCSETGAGQVLNDAVRMIEDSLIMRRLMVRDPLTQLYNRRFFEDQIDEEWRRALRLQTPISLAISDIDHFKDINDAQGHDFGDQVLCDVAGCLESHMRRAGDVVCRYGGEEFAMILPQTPAEAAAALLESFRDDLRGRDVRNPRTDGPLTMSVGLVTVLNPGEMDDTGPLDCLRAADDALYAAKREGRDRIVTGVIGQASDPD